MKDYKKLLTGSRSTKHMMESQPTRLDLVRKFLQKKKP